MLLNNKKGFSITELITAVAILAIICGISIPWVMNANNSTAEANELARSFYFTLQNELTQLKLSGDVTNMDFLVCVGINNDSVYSSSIVGELSELTELNEFENKLTHSLEKHLANNYSKGFYYGFVDTRMRVVRTYWSADLDVVSDYLTKAGESGFTTELDTDSLWDMMPHNYEKNTGILIGTFPYIVGY